MYTDWQHRLQRYVSTLSGFSWTSDPCPCYFRCPMLLPHIKSFLRNAQKEQVDVALPWLLALRWGEVLCQIVLIGSVWLMMDIDIPLLPVVAILVGAVMGNQIIAWYPDLDLSPTWAGVLGALAVVIPVVVAIRLYDRAYRRQGPKVRILRTRG